MPKYLITGGTGFTGVNLVAALLARGDSVRVLMRGNSNAAALDGVDCEKQMGDVRDPGSVSAALEGCDGVFHLAALVGYWRATRKEVYSVNAEGTRVVMQACLEAGIRKVVHTSSVSAIGMPSPGSVATEDTHFDDRSYKIAYSDSKRLAEEHVLGAVKQGLPAVIVNPAQIVGPGDHAMYIGTVLRDLKKGYVPAVPSGGMCMVDVDAVVAGVLAAEERGRIGERYILGGENLSHLKLCEIAARVVGTTAPRRVIPNWVLPPVALAVDAINKITGRWTTISGDHVRLAADFLYYDSGKAVRELNYPMLPFEDALVRAYAWFLAEGYID